MAEPVVDTQAETSQAARQSEKVPRRPRSRVDAWMDKSFKFGGSAVKRKTIAVMLLGIPAFAPEFFMSRAIFEGNSNTVNSVGNDVFGTASMGLLILTVTITPLVTLTRQHWFVPLRKWYGILIACSATSDAIASLFTGSFAGGLAGQVAAHTFLTVGLTMVLILVPLALISNNRSQRWLGKYWKPLQRLTYVIWALLFVHLALLEGLGPQNGTNGPSASDDGLPVLHQRLYQLAACSLPLVLLRLPPIKRWVARKQGEGKAWVVNAIFIPLAAVYVLFFIFIVNEEIFKGVSAFRLQPVNG